MGGLGSIPVCPRGRSIPGPRGLVPGPGLLFLSFVESKMCDALCLMLDLMNELVVE